MDAMIEHAYKFIDDYGFAVFPVEGVREIEHNSRTFLCCTCGNPACENPGKHPAVINGLNSATKDKMILSNLWRNREHLNFGIATGAESGICVVDVDGIVGDESLKALEAQYGKLPDTLKINTPRGGYHLYFKYPNMKVYSRTNKWNKIDIRGDGGYVVAPPSLHIKGSRYVIEDASKQIAYLPEWLKNEICSHRQAPIINHEKLANPQNYEWTEDEVRRMLTFLNPTCDRSDWVEIGMALNDGGYSFELFDSWSRGSSEMYSPESCGRTWKSFKPGDGISMGTLVSKAKMFGWKPIDYIEDVAPNLETHPAGKFIKFHINKANEEIKLKSSATGELLVEGNYTSGLPFDPEELSRNHQLVTDTVRFLTSTAIFPQPELAFMAVITTLGALFGRRYACDIYNTRSNLLMAGLCSTASGKDHARKIMKNIMKSSGYEMFVGDDDIRSDSGLFTMMTKKPSCVMFIDEFGILLEHIHSDGAQSYKAAIARALLTMYSSSGSSIFPPSYADKKVVVDPIYNPNLCIYGVATRESYVKGMKRESIATGTLNRYIIIPGREEPDVVKRPYSSELNPELVSSWVNLTKSVNFGNLESLNSSAVNNESPILVRLSNVLDKLDELLITQVTEMRKNKASGMGGLWGRYRENAMKVGMILAISRDPINPYMSIEDLDIGEKVVRASVEHMMAVATEHMYENPYEREKRELFFFIKDSAKKGATRINIMRRFPGLTGKIINQLITDLIDDGSIAAVPGERTDGGKPPVCYKPL